MSYIEKRQNSLTHCPIEDVEQAFAKIAQYFGDVWLKTKSGSHVLQLLWNRRDALSTNELFTFGRSLIAAESASVDWLKGQIKLVRGKDENNQRGAIFELLTVGYTAYRQTVIPAPMSQPGYDIDIETKDGTLYRASLKRYSQSTHEKNFRKKSEVAEAKFLSGLKESRHNAVLYIEAKEYPSESDWQRLYSAIYQLSSDFRGYKTITEVNGKWLTGLLPLVPEQNEEFVTTNISYSFVCASPYHKNEQMNFFSKLETAIFNLEHHVTSISNQVPIIIMQLPVTAPAPTLTSWAKEYLSDNPSSLIEAIFFLQPYTASNKNMSSSYIAHFASAAVSNSFHTKAVHPLEFEVPAGIITRQPPEWRLQSDIGEKQLPEQYVYQKGKHYISASKEPGGFSANITRKAPGIESVAVFTLNGQNFTIGGRWGEDLCLIGG
jgi:hypothetical protein